MGVAMRRIFIVAVWPANIVGIGSKDGAARRNANLPNFALDRLSRYEATLCRQVSRVIALDTLGRRKPQERSRRVCFGKVQHHWP
jgi:hypothetical protein